MEQPWPDTFSPEVVKPFLNHLSTSTIALEAWRRGLSVTLLDGAPRRFLISDEQGNSIKFSNARPEMTTQDGMRLAKNKFKTTSFLAKNGFPTPRTRLLDCRKASTEDVVRIAKEIGFPVVLKPLAGSKGDGVFTGIADEEALLFYYRVLADEMGATRIVMESHEDGEMDLRVLVVGKRVVGVIHRVPANIIGDGVHTVAELINAKNKIRSQNPFLRSGLIKRDREVENYVRSAGHTMDTVPTDGEYLRLRGKSNGSAGGDTAEVSHMVSARVCAEIAKVVENFPGLYAAGVDILYTPQKDGVSEEYTIIEINATPQIALNMYPMEGEGRDSPKAWVDECFPSSARSAFPGEESLTFSLEEPLAALRAGTASEITLRPIPANRLPYRHIYSLGSARSWTAADQRRIRKLANTLGVSGSVSFGDGGHLLHAAADDTTSMETFTKQVSSLSGTGLNLVGLWDGVIRQGFRFHH